MRFCPESNIGRVIRGVRRIEARFLLGTGGQGQGASLRSLFKADEGDFGDGGDGFRGMAWGVTRRISTFPETHKMIRSVTGATSRPISCIPCIRFICLKKTDLAACTAA